MATAEDTDSRDASHAIREAYFWVALVCSILALLAMIMSTFKHFYYFRPYKRAFTDTQYDGTTSYFSPRHPLEITLTWLTFFGFTRVPACPLYFEYLHLGLWIVYSLMDRILNCIRDYGLLVERGKLPGGVGPTSFRKGSSDSTVYGLMVAIYLILFLFYVFGTWFVRSGTLSRILANRPESANFFEFDEFEKKLKKTRLRWRRLLRGWWIGVLLTALGRTIQSVIFPDAPVWWLVLRNMVEFPVSVISFTSVFVLLFTVAIFLLQEVSVTRKKMTAIYQAMSDQARGLPIQRSEVDAFSPSLFFHTYAYLTSKIQLTGDRLSAILALIVFSFVVLFSVAIVRFLSFGRDLLLAGQDIINHGSDFVVAIPLLIVVLAFARVSSRMYSVRCTAELTLGYFVLNGYKAVKQTDVLVMIQSIGNLPYAFLVGGIMLDNGAVVKGFSLFFSLAAGITALYDYSTQ
jgi:hypothetical protein